MARGIAFSVVQILVRLWRAGVAWVMLPLRRQWVRFLGATVDRGVTFSTLPYVRVFPGSAITFGPGVIVHSNARHNPIIGRRFCSLTTLAPGARITLNKDVGVSGACLAAAAFIDVGEGTIIGADAMVFDNDFHAPTVGWGWANDCRSSAKGVTIGRGCFIGARAIVLKGVTIGDGAIVGAGAVVTGDVPPGFLAIGNPASTQPLPARWCRGTTQEAARHA
jgi:acetyltransferase-like isoleucine patch superfamily enzyme